MGVCNNCKHWAKEKDKYEVGHIADGVDARPCALEPFDISSMTKKDCAIICGHDGAIYFGSEFGCVRFDPI